MDNSSRFLRGKIKLRRGVLERINPSKVLDLFSGNMWKHAWAAAHSYLGVDARTWRSDEPHRRLMMDAMEAVSTLDLSHYNIFDVDVYGDPWIVANEIMKRRVWAPGERGGIIFTDGLSMKIRLGGAPASQHELIGYRHHDLVLRDVSRDYHIASAKAWFAKCRVKPVWGQMIGGLTGRSSSIMWYSAHVFEGQA